jgi:hypothetical protein
MWVAIAVGGLFLVAGAVGLTITSLSAHPRMPAGPMADAWSLNDLQPVGATDEGACDLPDEHQTFGTAVEFARNPVEAARLAKQQRKLTFLLHVSGNFEENRFT